MKGTAKYSCMNLSGRQIVMGRRYQETDSCLYQICISDWCGVKSFAPPVERCKALVQQEQISDVLQNRGETGDQILNSFIEPKHNPCNSLWLYESHQRKLGYRYLKRYLFKPETSPALIKRINKFWKAIKKECNGNSSVSIQKPKALTATATFIYLRNSFRFYHLHMENNFLLSTVIMPQASWLLANRTPVCALCLTVKNTQR